MDEEVEDGRLVIANGKRCAKCKKRKDVELEFQKPSDEVCIECDNEDKGIDVRKKKLGRPPKAKQKKTGRTILERLDTLEDCDDGILERLVELEEWKENLEKDKNLDERIEKVEELIGENNG